VPLVGAACALALFGRNLPRLRTHFYGVEDVDAYGTWWFHAFVAQRVAEGGSWRHTDAFFHPVGKDLLRDTGANVLDALIALPLRAAFGPVAGENLLMLLGLAAAAWAFSRLARVFFDDAAAVWTGALLFALSPYALHEWVEGRPTQALLVLFPLLWLQVHRTLASPGWRAPLVGGLLLAAVGYQYWFYGLFSGWICGAMALAALVRPGSSAGGRAAIVGRIALLGGVALILCAPVALPLWRAAAADDVTGLLDTSRWSMAELSLRTLRDEPVSMTSFQPWTGRVLTWVVAADGSDRLIWGGQLLSAAAALLVLLGLWRPGGLGRRQWGTVVLVAGGISLGPLVWVGEQSWTNPLYVGLVEQVSVMRRLWWPVRAWAWLSVAVALAATAALAWAGRRGVATRTVATLLATAGWMAGLWWDGLVPFPAWSAAVPAGYTCLAHGPPGAILELPYGYSQAHLYYQATHGRPMFGGMAERSTLFEPQEHRSFRLGNRYVKALLDTVDAGTPPGAWRPEDRDALAERGYRYVVLQKDAFVQSGTAEAQEMAQAVRRTRLRKLRVALPELLGDPVYEDARLVIYAPWGGGSPCATVPVDPDTEPRRAVVDREDLRPGGRVE